MGSFLSMYGRLLGAQAALTISAFSVVSLRPSLAHAQAERPATRGHHVESTVGIVLSAHSHDEPAIFFLCPCPPPPKRPQLHETGAGLRVGYRFRPITFFELGISGEGDVGTHARVVTVPLMAYFHLATDGGSSLSFGLGGGVSRLTGDGLGQTVGIARGEIGGAIPVSPHWSISMIAQLSLSARGFRAKEKAFDFADDNPEWLTLGLGPRYSF